MKFTIMANGSMRNAKVTHNAAGEVESIEFDFTVHPFFSDLEFWLLDEGGEEYKDHKKMSVSKAETMKFYD